MNNNFILPSITLDPVKFESTYPTYEGEMNMTTLATKETVTLHYYEVPTGRFTADGLPVHNWFLTEDVSLAASNLNARMADLDDLYDAGCVSMDIPFRDKVIKVSEGRLDGFSNSFVEWTKTTRLDAIGREESFEQFEYVY